ncbi:hypothetical protein NIM87_17160 [Devosia sp. XJ19-1]|uniref:Yip1 domain-containing protein n=1 Tax=Devosia ureilytica TaxID=2952754 RepID=A0A9Q4FUN5_9HYPH|nr:hypothetical protein [Devosia ureilytica]MCP8885241.1 hypothetical protein [Devosia ureilytica]MCP8888699.1 hypothetical protein [Devosia ureilytica]
MKIFTALRQAIYGWIMLLRSEPGWQERFRFTASGLVTALVLFYLFAFLAVVLASLDYGVPGPQEFVATMVLQSLWLVALVAGLYGTRFAVRDKSPILPILVPGVYALVFYLVVGALVSLVLGFLLPLLWLALVWMLFRLGRLGGGWTIGVSFAFAILTVLLLVGLPYALYIIPAPTPAA